MLDLASAKAKLGRAKIHMEAVKAILKDGMGANFYTVTMEDDRKRRLIVKVVTLKQFPPEFALAVGDAAHNLRSALDHIVFAAAKKPLTSAQEQSLQFPLYSKREKWVNNWRRILPRVPIKARALVNRFQPYHRRKCPENRLLGQLQAVNNWDKHRRLSITGGFIKYNDHRIEVVQGSAQVSVGRLFRGRLKVGTVLARFNCTNRSPDFQVHVQGNTTLVPVFGEGMPKEVFSLSVTNRLRKWADFIEKSVIPEFEAL